MQGDGELNGNAPKRRWTWSSPSTIANSADDAARGIAYAIMTVGLGGTLEDALRAATSSLGQWLEQDHNLTPSEIAMVLGTSVEYTISEVADRNAGVVAKFRKDRLTFNK